MTAAGSEAAELLETSDLRTEHMLVLQKRDCGVCTRMSASKRRRAIAHHINTCCLLRAELSSHVTCSVTLAQRG